ncbi:hypothetical protein [Marininema halotolerans]|uniref:hypothetical protein n=1 Tax=Marininema halotolerans TaxID=1155944 RepID=UPI000B87B742|nr:hypothetical protein [Marininema halotolerans]
MSDKEYKNRTAWTRAIEFLDNDVVRITIHLGTDDDNEYEPPRTYIKVEKNTMVGKKFIVVTEGGDKLNIN